MVRIKPSKTVSSEMWLLYVSIATAIASLTALDYHRISTVSLASYSELPQVSSPAQSPAQPSQKALQPFQPPIAQSQQAIAAPKGWKAVEVSKGVVAYVAPSEATLSTTPDSRRFLTADSSNAVDPLDGTRSPYVTEVDLNDLLANPVAPKRYVWQGVWQGEGYSRQDQNGRLVAQREGGNDIYLTLSYDATITDPQQPNLIVTIASQQDKTAQLTNLSAFLLDAQTGEAIERKDFAQLPPFYDVSLSHFGKVGGAEVKTLAPLGTVTFADYISTQALARTPLVLQAVNQFVDERAQEIAALEAQGWLVKEVPPLQ